MSKVHEDIDYIYKAYDLVEHQYQEINQSEKIQSVKNKWLPSAVSGQNVVNLPKQESLDIFTVKDKDIVNSK